MKRSAQKRIAPALIAAAVLVSGAGGVVVAVVSNSPAHKVGTTLNAQSQLTDIKYNGQDGVNALTLLKKHANVQVKHYSFGDLVTAIDGSKGTGPKYWTFYINGQQAQVGAGTYVTKSSDKIEWKLQ